MTDTTKIKITLAVMAVIFPLYIYQVATKYSLTGAVSMPDIARIIVCALICISLGVALKRQSKLQ
jgi:uncharacterized membrane protein